MGWGTLSAHYCWYSAHSLPTRPPSAATPARGRSPDIHGLPRSAAITTNAGHWSLVSACHNTAQPPSAALPLAHTFFSTSHVWQLDDQNLHSTIPFLNAYPSLSRHWTPLALQSALLQLGEPLAYSAIELIQSIPGSPLSRQESAHTRVVGRARRWKKKKEEFSRPYCGTTAAFSLLSVSELISHHRLLGLCGCVPCSATVNPLREFSQLRALLHVRPDW